MFGNTEEIIEIRGQRFYHGSNRLCALGLQHQEIASAQTMGSRLTTPKTEILKAGGKRLRRSVFGSSDPSQPPAKPAVYSVAQAAEKSVQSTGYDSINTGGKVKKEIKQSRQRSRYNTGHATELSEGSFLEYLFRSDTLHFKGVQKHDTFLCLYFLTKMGHIDLQHRNEKLKKFEKVHCKMK